MKDANLTLKVGAGTAKAYQGQVQIAQVKVVPGSERRTTVACPPEARARAAVLRPPGVT
jgi:hypothetical protein